MAELRLEGVEKRFGPIVAVDGVDLTVPPGTFLCFLGPSGCGKTTLLRLIAGLETPSGGRIDLNGQDVTGLPTHQRNIGMVFQSLALFPHLNVGENIAYGMRVRGLDKAAQARRIDELLEMVQLPGLADRNMAQLSGGQRQRIAIARALALEPSLFLLDEPLSALDAKLRETMQVELRILQQRLGVTTILVTHDQREAMTMSDMVAVMGDGRIQQVGTPLDIYRRPANAFVADFIGTTNMLDGIVDSSAVKIGDSRFAVSELPDHLSDGDRIHLSIRPEELVVAKAGCAPHPPGGRLEGTVAFVRDVGATIETHIDCGTVRLIAAASPKDRPEVRSGDRAVVCFPPDACVVLAK